MKGFLRLFDSELDHLMDPVNYIDCRLSPDRLMRELKNQGEVKKLVKYIENNSSNPFKYVKVLSICNLLLIYSKDFNSLIE